MCTISLNPESWCRKHVYWNTTDLISFGMWIEYGTHIHTYYVLYLLSIYLSLSLSLIRSFSLSFSIMCIYIYICYFIYVATMNYVTRFCVLIQNAVILSKAGKRFVESFSWQEQNCFTYKQTHTHTLGHKLIRIHNKQTKR